MSANQFSSGKNAIANCDICGFQYKLHELKMVVRKTKDTNLLACPDCWDEDHPQWLLGMYPVDDPQALRNPRRDNSYFAPGANGATGSRVVEWGWNPVGGAKFFDRILTTNSLIGVSFVNSVTVVTT
jgi:hypothetical protein